MISIPKYPCYFTNASGSANALYRRARYPFVVAKDGDVVTPRTRGWNSFYKHEMLNEDNQLEYAWDSNNRTTFYAAMDTIEEAILVRDAIRGHKPGTKAFFKALMFIADEIVEKRS